MFNKTLLFLSAFFLLFSCTSDETPPEDEKEIIQDVLIELNIENDVVVSSDEIVITVTGDAPISNLEVLLDSGLLQNFSAPPYSLIIDPSNYEDGAHTLEVAVYSNGEKVGSKTITIKIDNSGPSLVLTNIRNNEVICDEISITSQINDAFSEVEKIEVYLDETLLFESFEASNSTFSLTPDQHPAGDSNLKFVMEDELGNISKDSINIKIGKKILAINFPDNFARNGTDTMHVILSDANGKFLDSKTHSGQMETLEFCSSEEFGNDTEFMLSFVGDFQESIYGFTVYSNLTKNILGGDITMPARTAGVQPAFPDLDVSFYDNNYYMRGTPPWGSMIYHSQTFSGHVSRTFSNAALGTNKTFIQYYNKFQENDYQWAFIEDIHTRFSLEAEDFTSDNVIHGSIAVNGSFLRPFMSIHGYENEAHYNALSGHMIYWNPSLLGNSTGYNYSYANIFDFMVYSFKVKNYTIEGAGAPPASVTVPNSSIDYTYLGDTFSFTGLPQYEVGRLRLKGTNSGQITTENPLVNMEFIFNGESTQVILPEIPDGLFPAETKEVFDTKAFEVVQGAAENYSSLIDYGDYISKVLVAGKPFFKVADKRERIFKSSVGTQFLPTNEFPFYERF